MVARLCICAYSCVDKLFADMAARRDKSRPREFEDMEEEFYQYTPGADHAYGVQNEQPGNGVFQDGIIG